MRADYSFGGIKFAVISEIPLTEKAEIEQFRAHDRVAADYIITVVADEVNTTPVRDGRYITVPVKEANISNMSAQQVLLRANAAQLFPLHDAFILHASYVVCDGRAIVITAPSGTGKSTLAEHWTNTVGGEVINGDRVLLARLDGEWTANGVYVSGTSGICKNVTAPLTAVVVLEQRESDGIIPIRSGELFARVLSECTYDDKSTAGRIVITELVADLINTVPTYAYGCLNHPDAALELEKLIWNRK